MKLFDWARRPARKAAAPVGPPPNVGSGSKKPSLASPEALVGLLAGLRDTSPKLAPLGWNKTHEHKVPKPMPGVVPARTTGLAMDSAQAVMASQFGGVGIAGAWDGYSFMGYALLSELAQVTEFRRPSEILANEMTRKWGKIVSKSNADKTEKIKQLTGEMDKFQVQEVFRRGFELDNFFGIGHIYIDLGTSGAELKSPLSIKTKVAKGSLKALTLVEPLWTYPNQYNASNALSPDFYRPQTWFALGMEVHASRLLSIVSRPVPDMLKPAYQFGGVALTQLMKPYVENWLRTRQSISDITHNFSTPVLGVDMDQMTTTDGAKSLALRAQIYNITRDNQGLFVISKEKESFEIEAAPLASLPDLQAQAMEQMAIPGGIPLVKFFGITPKGLNASSEGEIRVFYDTVLSVQERVGTPHIDTVLKILQMNAWGDIDEDLGWMWNPLWSSSDSELAQIRKANADTDAIYVELGALDTSEVRKTLASEEDSRYASINVNVMPQPPEDEDGEQIDLGTAEGQLSAMERQEREDRVRGRGREDDRGRADLLGRQTDRQLTATERGARE